MAADFFFFLLFKKSVEKKSKMEPEVTSFSVFFSGEGGGCVCEDKSRFNLINNVVNDWIWFTRKNRKFHV